MNQTKLIEILGKAPFGELFVAEDHVFVPKSVLTGAVFSDAYSTRNFWVFEIAFYKKIQDKMELPDVEVLTKIE